MSKSKKVIKVFGSEYCSPCHEIEELIKAGRFLSNVGEDVPIDLIDITTEEGFPQVVEENLSKVPSARFNHKPCELSIDRELNIIVITCGEEGSPEQRDQSKDTPE